MNRNFYIFGRAAEQKWETQLDFQLTNLSYLSNSVTNFNPMTCRQADIWHTFDSNRRNRCVSPWNTLANFLGNFEQKILPFYKIAFCKFEIELAVTVLTHVLTDFFRWEERGVWMLFQWTTLHQRNVWVWFGFTKIEWEHSWYPYGKD